MFFRVSLSSCKQQLSLSSWSSYGSINCTVLIELLVLFLLHSMLVAVSIPGSYIAFLRSSSAAVHQFLVCCCCIAEDDAEADEADAP